MVSVRRSDQAKADLVDIWIYIARYNPQAASDLLHRIHERCRRLAEHPLAGRARPELRPELRSVAVGRHVIFYEPIEGGIVVVRVLHGARKLDDQF